MKNRVKAALGTAVGVAAAVLVPTAAHAEIGRAHV